MTKEKEELAKKKKLIDKSEHLFHEIYECGFCAGIAYSKKTTIGWVMEIIEKLSYDGVNINYDQIKSAVLALKGEQG